MIAHDNDMVSYVGKIVDQGDYLGSMGDKGNATGVHCHIEISQSNDTSWYKNKYGIYMFNNEYNPYDCYFVDYTNIIQGLGGDFITTSETPLINLPGNNAVDQIIYIGSKVKFDGIFKVDIIKRGTNLFGNTLLTGVTYSNYYNEKAKDYHWIPLDDFTEVDKYGSSVSQDDIVYGGSSYVINNNVYEVKEIDIPTNSAKLNLNGRDVWVFSTFLYEVG